MFIYHKTAWHFWKIQKNVFMNRSNVYLHISLCLCLLYFYISVYQILCMTIGEQECVGTSWGAVAIFVNFKYNIWYNIRYDSRKYLLLSLFLGLLYFYMSRSAWELVEAQWQLMDRIIFTTNLTRSALWTEFHLYLSYIYICICYSFMFVFVIFLCLYLL